MERRQGTEGVGREGEGGKRAGSRRRGKEGRKGREILLRQSFLKVDAYG